MAAGPSEGVCLLSSPIGFRLGANLRGFKQRHWLVLHGVYVCFCRNSLHPLKGEGGLSVDCEIFFLEWLESSS